MKPSTPSKSVWVIGLFLGLLGILGHFIRVDFLSTYDFWFLLAGFALLVFGTSYRRSWF